MRLKLGTLRRVLTRLIEEHDLEMADHLYAGEEGDRQGAPPDETIREHEGLVEEMRRFFMQEGPAGAGVVDPREPKGAYGAFDMTRDHGTGEDLSTSWYRSPGKPAGTGGDPYRSEDPASQLGFHPPGAEDTTQLAPQIWQLTAGGDTSKVLGANAQSAQEPEEGQEEDGTEDGEEGTEETGEGEPAKDPDEEQTDDAASGPEQGRDDPEGDRDR